MDTSSVLYGGLDLHGNNVYCSLMDASRRVHFERRLPNDLGVILQALEPFRQRVRELAVESTYNWYWLVDGLTRLGYSVRLANPARMQENIGLKFADDKTDARFIARQLVNGCLPEGYVYPEETRGVRDLLRHRMRLSHDRTTALQRLTALCARQTGSDLSGRELLACDLGELFDGHAESILMAEAGRRHAEFLGDEIKEIEKRVTAGLPDREAYGRLMTVPGIGPALARCILLETGPVTRFRSAGNYASYCRAVPTAHTSNGKRKGDGNAKCGNRYLGWAFVEAANFAVRHNPGINAWFQRKCAQHPGLRVVAVKAIANKLAKACFFILRDGTEFDIKRFIGGHNGKA